MNRGSSKKRAGGRRHHGQTRVLWRTQFKAYELLARRYRSAHGQQPLVDWSTGRLGRKRPSEPLCRVWRRISVELTQPERTYAYTSHGFVHVVLRQPAGDGGGAGARAGRCRRHSAKVRVNAVSQSRRHDNVVVSDVSGVSGVSLVSLPLHPTLQRYPADGGSERSAVGVSGSVEAD